MPSTLRRRAAITRTTIAMLVSPLLLKLLLQYSSGRNRESILIAEAFHQKSNAAFLSTFVVSRSNRGQSPIAIATARRARRTKTQLMCICVDCKWVTSCKAYHFVEKKHNQPHMSEEPTFLPREGSPTINVNIRTEQRRPKPKAGVVEKGRMWKDQIQDDDNYEDEEPKRDARYYEETGTVEAVNTNTTTTIEYDVVKCADFVLDRGSWVRNMPEEIKRVNPDFVPT